MRGAGDQLTVGERVAFYRARRGLTQTQLANLVGRGPDWLSKIERGERQLRNVETLAELAKALRVSLGDLLGQPVLMEDEPELDDVPAIRDALMAPARLSRVLYGQPSPATVIEPSRAAQLVEFAWSDYQRGRLGLVVAHLPGLIRAAQQLEDTASGSTDTVRRQSWSVSARTHHLAATALSKVGEADLSWIAAERAMRAADRSDDVLVLASTARAATHALLAVGRFEDAVDVGETAERWLVARAEQGDPEALSLFGMLHLRTAVAAARLQDRAGASELLDKAQLAADRLGEDADHWKTSFGPTNVALHRLSVGLDLGDVGWMAEHGPRVGAENMPVERRVTHLIDVARAMSHLARDSEALDMLLSAERESPALFRHNAAVREAVKAMYRRAPVTGGMRSSQLLELAKRCRAVR
ncbi:helix-turn-helix transcriptional regulator [Pseudonocardia aurantiaca]|uniref:Helix-turn-helix domain-containing protein n=1 Tax=Pseudonocardia aurantiaca TaxID=75290 RepID=A0ABW4FUI8_9PSEU